MQLSAWIAGYARAWERADEALLVALFSEDATYRSSPFREPHRGHDEIRAYWRQAAGQQRDARVRMGTPYVDGDRVAVEWWATMLEDGEPVTLPGCLLLRFAPDGRCTELREYWNRAIGHHEPPAGWAA